jgi:hypothetical protein
MADPEGFARAARWRPVDGKDVGNILNADDLAPLWTGKRQHAWCEETRAIRCCSSVCLHLLEQRLNHGQHVLDDDASPAALE